jgi:gamma-glutamyltranspeptidase/glutathione hydrolase
VVSSGGAGTGGAVAAGNPDTGGAAAQVLRAGGNAFDAAVAAGFAAAVAEPGLSSLGGGGFLLARTADGAETLFDFFVDAPGRGRVGGSGAPPLTAVTVRFPGADQVFHAGWGSVAVPGCLDGYLHVHRRLGRLPLRDVVAPARHLAADGVVLAPAQAVVLALLEGIVTLTPEGRAVFAPRGRLLGPGNEPLAGFLADVADGRVRGFAEPTLAGTLEQAMTNAGGLVTAADLAAYRVVEREPLRVAYRRAGVATNPPPSFGGATVADGLADLDRQPVLDDAPEAFARLADVLVRMSERHTTGPTSVVGTTHVSVADGEGNVAAMTGSNGSCSGVFVPGTGVQLNNVMGETDLHPRGLHTTPAGIRIGSMMAPTIVDGDDGRSIAVGSGGSERIRSTLVCIIAGLVDRRLPLAEALHAPRLHWDCSTLQVEPGLAAEVTARLAHDHPLHVWPRRDLYFGGANATARHADGSLEAVGDDRRGGVGLVLE